MTPLTDVLCRIHSGPVVGLCHGLFENLNFLKKFYKLETEDALSVEYGGLNHFFWMTRIQAEGKDLFKDLIRRLDRPGSKGFTGLLQESHRDSMGFKSNREVATELYQLTGLIPYLGDRHTCEFFPWYITRRENMRKYHLIRTSIQERRAAFQRRDKNLRAMIQGEIGSAYFKPSRETAANIIEAHLVGKKFIDVGNLPNRGQISNLPLGTVVETAVRVDRKGFTPLPFGSLPKVVHGFVAPWAEVFNLSVDACFKGDRAMALQALRLDPVCSHLNGQEVRKLGEALLKAHSPYLPQGFPP